MNAPSLPAQLRRRVGAAITDGFFLGLANGVGALPVARPSLWNLEVERDVPYWPGAARRVQRAARGSGALADRRGVGGALLFVAWGRWFASPITPHAQIRC